MDPLEAQRQAAKAVEKYAAHRSVIRFHSREAFAVREQYEMLKPHLTDAAIKLLEQKLQEAQ